MADALVEFLTVLSGELLVDQDENALEKLKNLPILLAFNKADSLRHVDKVQLEDMFQVDSLLSEYPQFNFTYCSALNGTNAEDILEWISNALFGQETKKKSNKGVCACFF